MAVFEALVKVAEGERGAPRHSVSPGAQLPSMLVTPEATGPLPWPEPRALPLRGHGVGPRVGCPFGYEGAQCDRGSWRMEHLLC